MCQMHKAPARLFTLKLEALCLKYVYEYVFQRILGGGFLTPRAFAGWDLGENEDIQVLSASLPLISFMTMTKSLSSALVSSSRLGF